MMSRRGMFTALSVAVASIVTLGVASVQAGPRDAAGAIKGRVYDRNRQVVAGARVALEDANHRVIAGTTSARTGEFRFGDVRPGHYFITAAAASGGRIMQGRVACDVVDGRITNVIIVVQ